MTLPAPGPDGRIRVANIDPADLTAWANEKPERVLALKTDPPQAIGQYLADRLGLAIVGRQVDGDDLVAAIPDAT